MNKFYIKKENFDKVTLEDMIMRKTTTGDFQVEVIRKENYEICGAMVYYPEKGEQNDLL